MTQKQKTYAGKILETMGVKNEATNDFSEERFDDREVEQAMEFLNDTFDDEVRQEDVFEKVGEDEWKLTRKQANEVNDIVGVFNEERIDELQDELKKESKKVVRVLAENMRENDELRNLSPENIEVSFRSIDMPRGIDQVDISMILKAGGEDSLGTMMIPGTEEQSLIETVVFGLADQPNQEAIALVLLPGAPTHIGGDNSQNFEEVETLQTVQTRLEQDRADGEVRPEGAFEELADALRELNDQLS